MAWCEPAPSHYLNQSWPSSSLHICGTRGDELTHWGQVTHICVVKLTTLGSDNGLSPGRRQAIIRTNAGILLIRTLGTNFSEILSEIHAFSFKKMHLKMASAKWRPFCLGLNVVFKGLLVVYVSSIDWTDWSRTLTGHGIYRTPQFNGRLNLNGESRWIWFRPLLRHDMEVNDFCIIGPLWGESSSDWWIPLAGDQLCVIRSFGVFFCCCYWFLFVCFFVICLNKLLNKQTNSRSSGDLRRHAADVTSM